MTMIARPDGSLSGDLFASCKKQLSKDSCASLEPLGMKWACICAEKKKWCLVWCLCAVCVCACCYLMLCGVIIVVVVLLVASALASMRWLLCGEKMTVPKKKVIAHKLHPQGTYLHHGKKRGKTQHLPNNEETKHHTQQKRGERSLIQRRWRKATPPNRRRKNSNTIQRRWKPSSTTQMERGGTQLHAQRTKRRQHHAREERKNSNTTQRKKRPNSTTQLSDMGGLFPATQLSFHTRIKKKKKRFKKDVLVPKTEMWAPGIVRCGPFFPDKFRTAPFISSPFKNSHEKDFFKVK